jgi:hypothetical protein
MSLENSGNRRRLFGRTCLISQIRRCRKKAPSTIRKAAPARIKAQSGLAMMHFVAKSPRDRHKADTFGP